jgi:hypothetical protein
VPDQREGVLVTPHDHVVSFYEDDHHLASELTRFVADGLTAGDAVLIVATARHRRLLAEGLASVEIDTAAASADGRFACHDARQTLGRFMVEGRPDRDRFTSVIGGLVDRSARSGSGVRAFGEMVAVLWDDGDVTSAIELESLWNELGQTRTFSLSCAYPLASLLDTGDLTAASQVCDCHSGIVAPPSYASVHLEADEGPASAVGCVASPETSQAFIPVPSAVGAVRRFVGRALSSCGDDAIVNDAVLVASELATNAIRHALSPFLVSVVRAESSVRIMVRDVNSTHAELLTPARDEIGGRGIALVACLSSRWGSTETPEGKGVWAEFAL